MARIIAGCYMVRYPLGGMMSWTLQWLVGLKRLGHEVFVVEKSAYADSCYDPVRRVTGNDCTHGLKTVSDLLERFELPGRLCYVDYGGVYHGMERAGIEEVFRSADLFLDLGTHGAWLEEAVEAGVTTVLVDGEPGYTQIKMEKLISDGGTPAAYDFYFSNGANIGTSRCAALTAGKSWRAVYNPVVTDLFLVEPPPRGAPYSTVMNWQSHGRFEYGGEEYGQKDIEFAKFLDLPRSAAAPMEVAVAGRGVPTGELETAGWSIRDAQECTISFDAYCDYIRASRGEFSVCKNVFVAMQTGWFSDRSAAYLASGRPVVLQDTGFSAHLPTGEGLFAVGTPDDAAGAIAEIEGDYCRQAGKAREIAEGYLEAEKILTDFLLEIGIG